MSFFSHQNRVILSCFDPVATLCLPSLTMSALQWSSGTIISLSNTAATDPLYVKPTTTLKTGEIPFCASSLAASPPLSLLGCFFGAQQHLHEHCPPATTPYPCSQLAIVPSIHIISVSTDAPIYQNHHHAQGKSYPQDQGQGRR